MYWKQEIVTVVRVVPVAVGRAHVVGIVVPRAPAQRLNLMHYAIAKGRRADQPFFRFMDGKAAVLPRTIRFSSQFFLQLQQVVFQMKRKGRSRGATAFPPHSILICRVEILPGIEISVRGGDLGYHACSLGKRNY